MFHVKRETRPEGPRFDALVPRPWKYWMRRLRQLRHGLLCAQKRSLALVQLLRQFQLL